MVFYDDIGRKARSKDSGERQNAVKKIQDIITNFPDDDIRQACNDLLHLTFDTYSDVRRCSAESLGAVFPHLSQKYRQQAWYDLLRLTEDEVYVVRWNATKSLGAVFPHLLFKQRLQTWYYFLRLTKDESLQMCAVELLGSVFPHLHDKHRIQAWYDLLRLKHEKDGWVKLNVAGLIDSAFLYLPIRQRLQAWHSLPQLTKDKDYWVRKDAARILNSTFLHLSDSDRMQAWDDMFLLTRDKDDWVRRQAAELLGSWYPYIPDINSLQAWDYLLRLTYDNYTDVRIAANHSLGRVSIFKASESEIEDVFRKEIETAIGFFEKASKEATYFNPSKFCLPFYRSFYTLAFNKEEAEAEVQRYLSEAKSAVEGSESKWKLLEAVENLGNALKEAQKARDFNDLKSDLNAYRRYCERACELLDTTEDKAPGASSLIRRGLPIIDERIKGIIAEIQEKAKALCKETKGTAFESLGKDVNNAGQNLLNVRDPIGLEKQVQNMIIVLKSICTSMPEEERGDACEFLKKANDEHYIEDKLGSINMVLSKIPTHIRKAIVMTKIEIKNSTNTQVALGNGNIQEIRISKKPEYVFDKPEKPKKTKKSEKESVKKSPISIDEKIQRNNTSIKQILDNWGFRPSGFSHGKREQKKADIENWLRCFSPSEFEDAFLILKKIQYHDSHAVDGYMEGLSRELKKIFDGDLSEIIFYPLGESPSSSGGNLLYSYRKNLGLPESSFPYDHFKNIDISGKKAIVFFDDIIGSGNQAVRFAKKHLQDIKIEKYYVALMAFEKGLEKVRNNGCFKNVIVHEIISEELRAFSPESQVFPDADTRERIKTLCEKYGKLLYPEYPLGFDDSQALIVFPHNTPNNTLPIIWASDKNEKEPGYVWYPVWERIKRNERKSNK